MLAIISSLQLVIFISIIILFTNLNPEDMTILVKRSFSIYWLILLVSFIFFVLSEMQILTGNFENALKLILYLTKLIVILIIAVKLNSTIKEVDNNDKFSYMTMIVSLIIYFIFIGVTIAVN